MCYSTTAVQERDILLKKHDSSYIIFVKKILGILILPTSNLIKSNK